MIIKQFKYWFDNSMPSYVPNGWACILLSFGVLSLKELAFDEMFLTVYNCSLRFI